MSEEKINREELYYILMSSWIYSIEKTRKELLGENIAYTKRIGWNATEYILDHLKNKCDLGINKGNSLKTLKNIIKCLEDMDFIKKGCIHVEKNVNTLSIEITGCKAEACKDLINKGITPQVCLRSIILDTLLEYATGQEYTYKLKADPSNQPDGICITYLDEL
ncbi:hypothetical protein [Methanobacterium sp.]|uniref:hypothetical protein n=1 Tax=Methanobacterium sp. TaxID=2164 RepID=UPI003C740C7F